MNCRYGFQYASRFFERVSKPTSLARSVRKHQTNTFRLTNLTFAYKSLLSNKTKNYKELEAYNAGRN